MADAPMADFSHVLFLNSIGKTAIIQSYMVHSNSRIGFFCTASVKHGSVKNTVK